MMKNFTKLFALVAVMFGFSLGASAQVSATANASATIIAPITIVWASDMDFGNIATSGTGGTVALDVLGGRLETGGVTLPANEGTVTAASFTIGGVAGATYSITIPTSDITISDGASNTMTVGNFISNYQTGTSTLAGGTDVLNLGATLTVGDLQAPGVYTLDSGIEVTVNYN